MLRDLLLLFIGGGLGSVARYGVSRLLLLLKLSLEMLPIATLTVNVVGSALIGVLMGVALRQHSESLFLFAVIGFCGGFTTFSTFSLELLTLFRSGEVGVALLYTLLSLVGCVAACAGGYYAVLLRQ